MDSKLTSINFQRCNIGSAVAHNLRTKAYLEGLQKSGKNIYFFPEEQSKNLHWVNPEYAEKDLQQIFDERIKLYKEKIGRNPKLKDEERTNKKTGKKYTVAGWSPIREGVVVIKEDTKISDFDYFKWVIKDTWGIDIIRIDIHHDEGYLNTETGEIKYNHHAHIVADWVDEKTGKTFKLNKEDMSEMQDMIAYSLDMKRGKKKSETGLEHIKHTEYRAKKAQEDIEEKERSINDLETTIEERQKQIATLPTDEEIDEERRKKLASAEPSEFEKLMHRQKELEKIKLTPEEEEKQKKELKGNIKLTEAEISATKAQMLKEVKPTALEVKAAKTAKLGEIQLTPEEIEERKEELKKNIKLTEAEISATKAQMLKEVKPTALEVKAAKTAKLGEIQLTPEEIEERKEVAKLQQMKNNLEQALSFLEQEAQEMSRSLDNNEITFMAMEITADSDEFSCSREAVEISLDNGIEDKFFIAELANEIKRQKMEKEPARQIILEKEVEVFGEKRERDMYLLYKENNIWTYLSGQWQTLKDALLMLGKKVMQRIKNPRQKWIAEIVSEKKSINLQPNTKKGRGI